MLTRVGRFALRALRAAGAELIRRGYAAALMAVILYASWQSVSYLITQLMTPPRTPAQIAQLPRRVDEALLHGHRPDWTGLAAVENPRTPLAHFHRFDTWLQSDPRNDCTRSGCHAPLPHSERKEVRAFLNMHATSIQCGVCHVQSDATPLELTWYSVSDGRASEPPALLRAIAWLDTHPTPAAAPSWTADDQRTLLGLVGDAVRQSDDDPTLVRLAAHLDAFRAGSSGFADAVEEARIVVRRALRGAYGTKLALRGGADRPILGHPGTAGAIRDWLANGAAATGQQRENMLRAVHPRKRETPLDCGACHREQGSLIDFARLGYPETRRRELHEPAIFRMIEHISKGEPFHLPDIGVGPRP
ncbi:MAG: hypothetical protein CHACPFDD_02995 [Phycisphaerae bacterium]|nr:hypothetical protein [Phycisphaerae bacterium]